MQVYKGVDFRRSLLQWNGQYIIPSDLTPMDFRYVCWPLGGAGGATIESADAAVFWDEIWAFDEEHEAAEGILHGTIVHRLKPLRRGLECDFVHKLRELNRGRGGCDK